MEKGKIKYVKEVEPIQLDLPDPGEGKAWRRKCDGKIFYGCIYLGFRHFDKEGNRLTPPVREILEDFELVEYP